MDLIDFLTARLDEDEATARAASPGSWSSRDDEMPEYHTYGDFGWYVRGPSGSPEVEDTEQGKADVDHIARHDPARVLREVEAKRRIVARLAQAERLCAANGDEHAKASRGPNLDQAKITALRTHGWELAGRRDGLLGAAQYLAAVYADHPDYRETKWRA